MKIRKILILFVVLVSLTAAALADQTYTQYTQAEVEKIVYHMPEGLSYTAKAQAGHAEVMVDSAKSDWTYIAAQAALFDNVEFTFDMPMMDGAAHSKSGAIWVNPGYYATFDDAMSELYLLVSNELYDREAPRGWGMLADVSDETSTVIPTVYDQSRPILMMTLYYSDSDELIGVKYATLYITYTDASAQRVEFAGVPAERVRNTASLTGVGEVSISRGLVNYQMNAGFGGQISLTVTPPDGAKRYSVENGGSVGLSDGECNGDLQLSFNVSSQNDSYLRQSVAFVWLDDQRNVIDVESLAINVSVGDPKPWINYEADLELPDENGFVAVFEGVQELSGIGQTYKDGTITVAPTRENFMVSGTPDQIRIAVYLKAPEGAETYKYASYSEGNLLGEQHGTYNNYLQYIQREEAHAVNGDGNVRIEEIPVFKCAEYKNDPGLKVYYDANSTDRANGQMIMVEWYGKSGNLLLRQGLAVRFETMAMEVKTIVEVDVPDTAQNPTLIAEKASSGYALQVMSYPQTGEAQRHYELRLLDSNGDAQPVSALGSDVQLLIPYPDGTNQNSEEQFAVNHYTTDEPPEVQEVFSEAKGNITRTEAGLLLTVKSLSPFVISWEKPVHEHELVYTASGNTLTQKCEACGHSATATLEIKNDFVKGEKVDAIVNVSDGWLGDKPAISYASNDGQALASAPAASGLYSVSMTMGNAKVTCYFTIADPEVLPQTGDDSLPLTVLIAVMLLAVAGVIWLGRKRRING